VIDRCSDTQPINHWRSIICHVHEMCQIHPIARIRDEDNGDNDDDTVVRHALTRTDSFLIVTCVR
jgi:hypothetical protein